MRSSRAHFFLAGSACLALCLALLFTLAEYFQSMEIINGARVSERQLLSQLKLFHERLKSAESPEEAKAALLMIEGIAGLAKDSDGARELHAAFAPVLAAFAAKPREAEPRYQLAKKRELMETLVNAYRKEIPNGDIRVRASYLNILFDTQSSLLGETEEAERIYVKRSRERFDGLKAIVVGSSDETLPARLASVDSIFQSHERAVQQAMKWHQEKREALAKEEKALPQIASRIYSGEDSSSQDTRSTFLHICFVSLLIAVASFLCLYFSFKMLSIRSAQKMDSLLAYLRIFGSESGDSAIASSLEALRKDPDWAPLLAEVQRTEETFLRSCHNLLAVPRSMSSPFGVVGKDRAFHYWNDSAGALFGLTEGKDWGISDVLRADLVRAREGDTEILLEAVRHAFGNLGEDRFELLIQQNGEWQPFEFSMCPISTGVLAGGKVFFWREIRSEAERLNNSVSIQLQRIRDLVLKVTHQYAVDLSPIEGDVPAVIAMIGDLQVMKRKIDERELLWKSEIQALIDQETRQQEVLGRLSEELGQIRAGQGEAMELMRRNHGGEADWHDEVCVLERDLERWVANRQRLLGDLKQQAAVLDKVSKFEEQLRIATSAVNEDLETYQSEIAELRQFAEAARVHSVNLSFVRDPGYWEYASRTRAFAHELARFTEKADHLGEKVRSFLAAHPGGALAAHLNGPGLDDSVVNGIREEQERTYTFLRRWRESGEALLTGGEKALELLGEAEKKSAVVTQLGETSLLINQQARGNLERWN